MLLDKLKYGKLGAEKRFDVLCAFDNKHILPDENELLTKIEIIQRQFKSGWEIQISRKKIYKCFFRLF